MTLKCKAYNYEKGVAYFQENDQLQREFAIKVGTNRFEINDIANGERFVWLIENVQRVGVADIQVLKLKNYTYAGVLQSCQEFTDFPKGTEKRTDLFATIQNVLGQDSELGDMHSPYFDTVVQDFCQKADSFMQKMVGMPRVIDSNVAVALSA